MNGGNKSVEQTVEKPLMNGYDNGNEDEYISPQ